MPTPMEMDGLGIDPDFARPMFIPEDKQFVDHRDISDPSRRTPEKTIGRKVLYSDFSPKDKIFHKLANGQWKEFING